MYAKSYKRLYIHSCIQNAAHNDDCASILRSQWEVSIPLWKFWPSFEGAEMIFLIVVWIPWEEKGKILRMEQGKAGLFPPFFFPFCFTFLEFYCFERLERNGLRCTFNQARMVIIHECFLIWFFIIILSAFGSIGNLEGVLLFCEGCMVGTWVL